MIERAKHKDLFVSQLTERQEQNSALNLKETASGCLTLQSKPRRLVLELTNTCNINCIMCGRTGQDFQRTYFQQEWLQTLEPSFFDSEEVVLHGWGEPLMHPKFQSILKTLNKYPLRKYFCTNGMLLSKYQKDIFESHVDILAVSLDGASPETNNQIRVGSDFQTIINNVKAITSYRDENDLDYPYVNFVMAGMQKNMHELPAMVRLASALGVQEVKMVYLTVFDQSLVPQSLIHCQETVRSIFAKSEALAQELNVILKLPYIQGEDPAGNTHHRECVFPYRDLFVGSDGKVRPCVSTTDQLFSIQNTRDFNSIWNHPALQQYRKILNHPEREASPCKTCYHSSCANWNRDLSFMQIDLPILPDWSR